MGQLSVQIDGVDAKAEEGATILQVARNLGIAIPTLCYHPALSTFGACRLCSVEVKSRGKTRIVTSCNYPIEDGLVVSTGSADVIQARKVLIEMLLARAPKAKVVQDLAREYGVEKTRFKVQDPDNLCVLCGLCARVCEERMGVSAINFVGRGVDRNVQTPFRGTRDINLDTCIACGSCASVCPTGAIKLEENTSKKPMLIPSEFDAGLRGRHPVYIPFPQAVPNTATIDGARCVHFLPKTGDCGVCRDLCQAKAIDFEQQDEIVEIEVSSIVVATGFDLFDPARMPQYGYGRYPNVFTSLECERLLNATGPTSGQVLLKDGSTPKSVAIIHCVGSRDKNYRQYCSRVCCMYSLKQAHLIRERAGADIYQMYIDMRCFGKGYEEFYERVSEEGINFIRGKASRVTDVPANDDENGKLIVICEDTLLGKMIRVPVDMVILGVGLEPRPDAEKVAGIFGLKQDTEGFFLERHPKLDPLGTATDGIYIAGCCQGPKDIPDSVVQASGAAARALSRVIRSEVEQKQEVTSNE